jgi:hypothetical protein
VKDAVAVGMSTARVALFLPTKCNPGSARASRDRLWLQRVLYLIDATPGVLRAGAGVRPCGN